MAIEIVDLPSYKIVIFHRFLYVYQAGYPLLLLLFFFSFLLVCLRGRGPARSGF